MTVSANDVFSTNLFRKASFVKSFVIVRRMPSAFIYEAEEKTPSYAGGYGGQANLTISDFRMPI